MILRRFVLLATLLVAATQSPCQTTDQRIATLEKLIEQCKQTESKNARLVDGLRKGTIVMVRLSEESDRIPMLTSEIIEYSVTLQITAELGKDKPDLAAAEKRGRDKAQRLIEACRTGSQNHARSIEEEMSKVRTVRQKAERDRDRLRLDRLAEKTSGAQVAGRWHSMVGRYGYKHDLTLAQDGDEITGTWTHATGTGSLKGTMKKGVLTFTWTSSWSSGGQSGTDQGSGSFTFSGDGKTFSGSFSSSAKEGFKNNPWQGHKL